MANKHDLSLFLNNPRELIFMQKDDALFDVPNHFFTERYQPIGNELTTRNSANVNRRIPVKDITPPDLTIPASLGRQEQFSLFIPKHRRIAAAMIDIFMNASSIDDLQSIAAYSRDRICPLLYNYALSVALLHRADTKDVNIPSIVQTFPDKYVDSKIFGQAREEANVVPDGSRMPIIIPRDYTASNLEEEHRLWYFREDPGVNLHHWHWHLVYPFDASDRSIVAKDRRGELFYYMHQQIMGRYNFERFSCRMARVRRLNNLRDPIPEAYFPKMDSLVASRSWPARPANSKLRDLNRELDQINMDVQDLERWRDRFFEAIHQRFVVDTNGTRIPLDETRGIDILGDMMEASILTPNRQVYGDLHNMGHTFVSYCHDPDHRYLESFGVIGDPATAMRDPVFYCWHAYVNDIFLEHKDLLPPYNMQQLGYPGVQVSGASIISDSGPTNTLQTFWQQSDVDFSRGLDFVPRGNVFVRFTHLQHVPFTYNIIVNNSNGVQVFGTMRIFLGPKLDERGTTMSLVEQRHLMIELDRFIVSLSPGANTIRRRSTDSSVTIPFERTFRNVDANRPAAGAVGELQFNFCGCGWPQHMLIPKGLEEGMACDLFVMVTNYEDDRVDQDLVGTCNDASSFCGVRDRLYPDRRAMGFPFDRLPRPGVDRLNKFGITNAMVLDCTIQHTNSTQLRAQ